MSTRYPDEYVAAGHLYDTSYMDEDLDDDYDFVNDDDFFFAEDSEDEDDYDDFGLITYPDEDESYD